LEDAASTLAPSDCAKRRINDFEVMAGILGSALKGIRGKEGFRIEDDVLAPLKVRRKAVRGRASLLAA